MLDAFDSCRHATVLAFAYLPVSPVDEERAGLGVCGVGLGRTRSPLVYLGAECANVGLSCLRRSSSEPSLVGVEPDNVTIARFGALRLLPLAHAHGVVHDVELARVEPEASKHVVPVSREFDGGVKFAGLELAAVGPYLNGGLDGLVLAELKLA